MKKIVKIIVNYLFITFGLLFAGSLIYSLYEAFVSQSFSPQSMARLFVSLGGAFFFAYIHEEVL